MAQDEFSRRAELYAVSEGHRAGEDLDLLAALCAPDADDVALDVATGSGHTALRLAPHVRIMVASDAAPGMVAQAQTEASTRELGNVIGVVADVHALPFADASFDLVTCRIAAHHFSDVGRALSEVHRVLRPGGRFVIEDSLQPDEAELAAFLHRLEVIRDRSHQRSLARDEWTRVLGRSGLEPVEIHVVNKARDFELWCARGTMTPEERAALDTHVQQASRAVREHFLESDAEGSLTLFRDQKIIIKAVSQVPQAATQRRD